MLKQQLTIKLYIVMKITSVLLSIVLSFICFSNLQAQKLEKSLLWEISGNGLNKPSYLFGTIHMTCDATLDKDILDAMDNTSLLVLELDMDDPNLQMKMLKGIYMKDGKTIKDLVSEDDYTMLSTFIKDQLGMPLDMIGNMKPFLLTAMFYPKLLNCPIQSIESELMKIAHDQKEEILGLETVEEQMKVFDEIPYEDQVIDLLRTAKDNLAYDRETFKTLIEIYNNEDIQAMDEMMKTDKNLTSSKHGDKMLDKRNKNWISKITEFSSEQPTFYGVGAAHLAGKNGVINLLRKAGYSVKAVK